jgi:hypothetical protein
MGMESVRAAWWHCFVASLSDGLLVLGIFAVGWVVLRQHAWFVHPGVWGYSVMMTTGLVISITIEWIAVHLLERWMYTAWMPRVPGLAVGLVPVLQMLILPPPTCFQTGVSHSCSRPASGRWSRTCSKNSETQRPFPPAATPRRGTRQGYSPEHEAGHGPARDMAGSRPAPQGLGRTRGLETESPAPGETGSHKPAHGTGQRWGTAE